MEVIKKFLLFFMTDHCFEEYFYDYNFLDGPCLKSTISKCLGVGIIGGSILVKVPQILKILKSKSGEGLNILAINLEMFALIATIGYSFVKGFPFSAWGDATFLFLQTIMIGFLVLVYCGEPAKGGSFVMAYLLLVSILISGIIPISVLWVLQAFNIPILLTGKMMQAHSNYKNQSTGQLSAITCIMMASGAIARIFTSIQETGDFIVILTYIIASFANCVIVGQLFWYWNNVKHVKKD